MKLPAILKSHNPATEGDVEGVDLVINPLLEKDNNLFTGITDAQNVMAKKFKFDLE